MEHYALGRCSVALCLLDLLAREYRVDLYVTDVWLGKSAILKNKAILIIDPTVQTITRFPFRILRKMRGAWRAAALADRIRARCLAARGPYDLYLAFDPHGFIRCISLFPDSTPIYFSLELYFKDNSYNLYYSNDTMRSERAEIGRIKGLIIQSREREELFRREYNLLENIPSFLLPVTHLGAPVPGKSNLIRVRYKIQDGKKLLLHLGAIAPHHRCLEMIDAIRAERDWFLVFHGHPYRDYFEMLQTRIRETGTTNILFTNDVFDDLGEIDDIVAGCDAGICWYADLSPNYNTAGKSSGKITAYLRCGLPVITNAYLSSRDAIETTEAGICIATLDELTSALRKIESRYAILSRNAIREYETKYHFERYRAALSNFLKYPKANTKDLAILKKS